MRNSVAVVLIIASSFHVDHEQVDFVPVGEPEYDEVIEEYGRSSSRRREPRSLLVLTLLTRHPPKASPGA